MEWCKQNMLSLTPSKLEMILFSNSRLPIDNFYLKIEDYNVTLKENITYLGLLVNKKLNWTNNIVSRCLKAKQYIFKIRRFVHSTWGIDGKILRMLYRSVVEPTILYGSPIWLRATYSQTLTQKLRSLQRLKALTIIRAYRTVSTNAAIVLAQLLPLDLRAQEMAFNFYRSILQVFHTPMEKFSFPSLTDL